MVCSHAMRHELIPAGQLSPEEEQTLGQLSQAPNLQFLKIFPRKGALSRARVVDAFNTAFEQIGGVSRLALWADSHPEEFYKLFARLLPTSSSPELDGDREVLLRHVLPPPPGMVQQLHDALKGQR